MDASFDQFGGGGWGDQGEHEFAASQLQKNIYDKVPIPAAIDMLISMNGDEEKYILGSFSFNTVKLMGKVANVSEIDQCTTYELCDPMATDIRVAKRFTVIRYSTADLQQHVKDDVFEIGQLVQIIGKLRLYNNRLSVVCFNIREVEIDEIAIHLLECKLAKIYFEKNLSEFSLGVVENDTIFHGKVSTHRPGSSLGQPFGGNITMPSRKLSGGATQMTATRPQMHQPQQKLNFPSHWTHQQQRIYEFIKHNAIGEAGVHKDMVKNALNLTANCYTDLVILSNEGAIYATIDDDHFGTIM